MATSFYTDIKLNGNKVINVADGSAADDVATFGQLSAAVAGIDLTGYTTDAEHTAEVNTRTTDDLAINARIDAINIIGDGLVTATETGDNTWNLVVDSLSLANTYSGTAGPSEVTDPQPGDIYIQTDTGSASIYTGTEWIELSSADVGVDAVNGTAGEIAVANSAGPAATVSLDPAIKTEIQTSTSTNTTQNSRLDAIEAVNTSQSAQLGSLNDAVVSGEARITAVESVNGDQDTRIGAVESANATQDTRLTAVETANAAQDTAIQANTDKNAVQDTAISNLQGADTALDGRVTAVEGVNGTQDTAIAALQTASHAAATGNAAIAVDGAQVVSLTLDPAGSSALSQSAAGLKLDTTALLGVAKKASGVVDLSTAASGTFTHNLNTVDVSVQTSVASGLVGLDVVATDQNTVTVSAKTPNSALAAVTVVVVG